MAASTKERYFGQDLLPFYERELAALKESAKHFAAAHPLIAARLNLDDSSGEDPHVERLLQGCAYLAARIQRRLHDDHPLLTRTLLDVVYPQLTKPVPSLSIASFEADYELKGLSEIYRLPRGTPVLFPSSAGVQCRFRTCYPVELVPMTVTDCALMPAERAPAGYATEHAQAVLIIKFMAAGSVDLSRLGIDKVRLYLDLGNDAYDLHELLFNRAITVFGRAEDSAGSNQGKICDLGRGVLSMVGLDDEECLLDATQTHLTGFRLLLEYFCFPQKFLFLDINELSRVLIPSCSGFEIAIPVSSPARSDRLGDLCRVVRKSSLRLSCTPIVNIFPHSTTPIRATLQQQDFPLVPKGRPRNAYEVYSVVSVQRVKRVLGREEGIPVRPLHTFGPEEDPNSGAVYWVGRRKFADDPAVKGTEVELAFLYRDGSIPHDLTDTFSVEIEATNRDLPAELPFGEDLVHLELSEPGVVDRVRCLLKPTAAIRKHLESGSNWELISHLSMNHLSFVEGGEEALKGILSLYNFRGASEIRRQINAIQSIRSSRITRPVGDALHPAFVRGTRVELVVDEAGFSGANPYLFSAIINRLLSSCCSINTFVELAVKLRNREGTFTEWTPTLGIATAI